MTFDIYNTPTAPDHLYKDISTVISPAAGYSGAIRGELSVDQPTVRIEAAITTGNYVKIRELGRYYWITERNVIRDGLTELTLQSDPLMSFAAQIVTLPILAARTEKQATDTDPVGYNSMIFDGNQKTLVRHQIQRKLIMTFTWSSNLNLVTVG